MTSQFDYRRWLVTNCRKEMETVLLDAFSEEEIIENIEFIDQILPVLSNFMDDFLFDYKRQILAARSGFSAATNSAFSARSSSSSSSSSFFSNSSNVRPKQIGPKVAKEKGKDEMQTLMGTFVVKFMGHGATKETRYHKKPHTNTIKFRILEVVCTYLHLIADENMCRTLLSEDLSSFDKFTAIVMELVHLVSVKNNKKRILNLTTRIVDGHGKKYVTGSGATDETSRRYRLIENLGGVSREQRSPRSNQNDEDGEDEGDEDEGEDEEDVEGGGSDNAPIPMVCESSNGRPRASDRIFLTPNPASMKTKRKAPHTDEKFAFHSNSSSSSFSSSFSRLSSSEKNDEFEEFVSQMKKQSPDREMTTEFLSCNLEPEVTNVFLKDGFVEDAYFVPVNCGDEFPTHADMPASIKVETSNVLYSDDTNPSPVSISAPSPIFFNLNSNCGLHLVEPLKFVSHVVAVRPQNPHVPTRGIFQMVIQNAGTNHAVYSPRSSNVQYLQDSRGGDKTPAASIRAFRSMPDSESGMTTGGFSSESLSSYNSSSFLSSHRDDFDFEFDLDLDGTKTILFEDAETTHFSNQ